MQDRSNSPADTVQLLGSPLGSTFVDGEVHPHFGTRNFTLPLHNGQCIEVVCPLDHPATEQTPWGKAVSKKAHESGGWFTWVFITEDISKVEEEFGRSPIEGHRARQVEAISTESKSELMKSSTLASFYSLFNGQQKIFRHMMEKQLL